jgi:prolyl-tRNA editing enzyme YbaK/EbsC (Cys-tRNA(Pro) deacylase)
MQETGSMSETILLPAVEAALAHFSMRYTVLECAPDLADTAAFCEHYHVALDQAANTILVVSKKVEPAKYALCVVLGTTRLDVNRKVCELLDVRRASFADAETTMQRTGMLIGGVTAPGVGDMPIYIDGAVMRQAEVVMGGGNRSSKLLLDPQELQKLPHVEVIEGLATSRE